MNLRTFGIIVFFTGAALLGLSFLLNVYSGEYIGRVAVAFDQTVPDQNITERYSIRSPAGPDDEYQYYLSPSILLTPVHSPLKIIFTSSFNHYGTPFKATLDFGKQTYPSAIYLVDQNGHFIWQTSDTHFNTLSKLWKTSTGQMIGSESRTVTFNDITISERSKYRILVQLHEQAYMGLKPTQEYTFRANPMAPEIGWFLLLVGGVLLVIGAIILAKTHKSSEIFSK